MISDNNIIDIIIIDFYLFMNIPNNDSNDGNNNDDCNNNDDGNDNLL